MRNKLRNISLYIISMTANLSSLCAAIYSDWEIRKRLTDYSELTFFTSNSNTLLKNKINCASLFQITLYEEVWWHVWACVISKDGLAIVEMRHWSQGPLQSPIQNVKEGALWFFLYGWSQKPFDSSPPLVISWTKATLRDIFSPTSSSGFFILFHLKTLFHSIWSDLIFENFAVQAWTISILEGCIQAQSTPRLFLCSLCLRVCSLSGSHNQMRLTVRNDTHCCCLLEQLSLEQKNRLVD
jgi:hypothetical protein